MGVTLLLLLLTRLGFAGSTLFGGGVGLELVSRGDNALHSGAREEARELYREALEVGGPEAIAMARLRLLPMSGNLGGIFHGPPLDRALLEVDGAWGSLAWADYHLFAPREVGARPSEAVDYALEALEELPGPAAARLYLATREARWLEALAAASEVDGLGRALIEGQGRLPRQPPTWYLGFGLLASSGEGFGGAVRFVHPHFAEAVWGISVSALSGGTAGGVAWRRGRGFGLLWTTILRGLRGPMPNYLDDSVELHALESLSISQGVQFGEGRLTGELQPRWRVDRLDEGERRAELGGAASLRFNSVAGDYRGHEGVNWRFEVARSLVAPEVQMSVISDLKLFAPALGGTTAARARAHLELGEELPFYRLPTVGGSELHRGALPYRWRGPLASTLDIEQRWLIGGPIEGVIFGNLALVLPELSAEVDSLTDHLHPAAGAGFRLILPPREFNIVRLDVAVSDSGWGLYTGWGEVF